jgi:hypothetical protein
MTLNSSGFFAGTVTPPEVNSTNELVNEITAQVATVTTNAAAAQAAATTAQAAATNAGIAETNVSTLAQQATTTLTQANAALTQANAAVAAASSTLTAAEASATAAASSATAASGSASTATTEATAASNSASAAAASQTAAAASATTASAQATSATNSSNAASGSATAASGSASAALASANTASTAASAASTSQSAAATSASGASASATAASNSAGTALTYSTNALNSQNAAAASATAAAASAAAITLPLPVASGGLGTTSIAQAVSVLGVSGKNRIINGDCKISQRGAVSFGPGVAGYGGPDRFFCYNGASTGQFTQSYSTMGINGVNHCCVIQTVNTACTNFTGSNLWNGFDQRIEGMNCFDLLGNPVALSFYFYCNNVSGNFSYSIMDGTSANSYVGTFAVVAGTVTKVVIPVASLPTTLGTAIGASTGLFVRIASLNTGTFQASTLNSWVSGEYLSAPGVVNWAATAGTVIAMTQLQLEAGSVATAFDLRSYEVELLLCERYYKLLYSTAVVGYHVAGNTLTEDFGFELMRANPTATPVSVSYSNASGYTVAVLSPSAVRCSVSVTTSGGAAGSCQYIALSAEL